MVLWGGYRNENGQVSLYKNTENVPDHMPETGGMLGGQNGIITKVVFDDEKRTILRRCHYTPNICNALMAVSWNGVKSGLSSMVCFILISTGYHRCLKEMKYILKD